MAGNGKPINPMERQENIGIEDGNAPSEEPVAEGRHGYGKDVQPDGLEEATAGTRDRDRAPDAPN